MSAFVTRTRGVDADELEELVKAAREVAKWIENTDDSFLAERLAAALKPFEKEEGR